MLCLRRSRRRLTAFYGTVNAFGAPAIPVIGSARTGSPHETLTSLDGLSECLAVHLRTALSRHPPANCPALVLLGELRKHPGLAASRLTFVFQLRSRFSSLDYCAVARSEG